jgi:hypothetical protein
MYDLLQAKVKYTTQGLFTLTSHFLRIANPIHIILEKSYILFTKVFSIALQAIKY